MPNRGAMVDLYTLFDNFVAANNLKQILHSFYLICTALDLDPTDAPIIYDSLRSNIKDWRAQKLWKLLDKKFEQAEYRKQKAADKLNVLIIGAGPCGLRSAIECALLGSRVVLVEERDKFSRNNVLHLWEFVIHDLKSFGAKIFYPKFCTGSIEHISIRQLQCILLKVALCYGVQIFEGVAYKDLRAPQMKPDGSYYGFRAELEPSDHLLADYEFDVLIGADGKRNTIKGFPRDEMRGKLAIGITANFVNRHTLPEERVPEISGVAYIFNQAFFKEMYATTGVDLENIVYYKDETHYFVMCAKKQSLLEKGVIIKDNDDVGVLLSSGNVNSEQLCNYALSAANFATHNKLPPLEYATNHKNLRDIAMFDFTSLYSSKCSVRLIERHGHSLLLGIVGDSLHEPFWPTGSGCARGFLGVMDTAWLIKEYGLNVRGPLQLIAERESIYRLLAQVTKDNLHKQLAKYTIDPRTRYVSLEITMRPEEVMEIVDTDKPRMVGIAEPMQLPRDTSVHEHPQRLKYAIWRFVYQALVPYKLRVVNMNASWNDGLALAALVAKFRPDCLDYFNVLSMGDDVCQRLKHIFSRVNDHLHIHEPSLPEKWASLSGEKKIDYIKQIVVLIKSDISRVHSVLLTPRSAASKRPKAMPTKFDTSKAKKSVVIENFQEQIKELYGVNKKILEQPTPPPTRKNLEIRLPTPTDEVESFRYQTERPQVSPLDPMVLEHMENCISGNTLRAKAKSGAKDSTPIADLQKLGDGSNEAQSHCLQLISREETVVQVDTKDPRLQAGSGIDAVNVGASPSTETLPKTTLAINQTHLVPRLPSAEAPVPTITVATRNQDGSVVMRPVAPVQPKRQAQSMPDVDSLYDSVNPRRQNTCQLCNKVVFLAERMQVESMYVHRGCFKCAYCCQPLRLGECGQDRELDNHYRHKFFCKTHLRLPLREKIARIEKNERKLAKQSSQDEGSSTDSSKENLEASVVAERISLQNLPPTPARSICVPARPPSRVTGNVLNFYGPDQLRNATMAKLRDVAASIGTRMLTSPVDSSSGFLETPERASFDPQDLPKKIKIAQNISSGESEDEESSGSSSSRERTDSNNGYSPKEDQDRTDFSPSNVQSIDSLDCAFIDEPGHDESLSDEEDNFGEEDLQDIDRTVLEDIGQNPNYEIGQRAAALSVLERINSRRIESSLRPERASNKNAKDSDILVSKIDSDAKVSPEMPIIRGPPVDLERLREEARQRARLKSDEQLGIVDSPVTRLKGLSPPGRERAATTGQLENDLPPMLDKLEIKRQAFSASRADTAPEEHVTPSSTKTTWQPFYGFRSPTVLRHSRVLGSSSQEVLKEPASSESAKENELRARHSIWEQLRGHRNRSPNLMAESPRTSSSTSSISLNSDTVPCAAVAPSPRPPASTIEKTTVYVSATPPLAAGSKSALRPSPLVPTLLPSDRNLRFIQKRSEKIRRQYEEDKLRVAQDLQRQLDESETRLEAIQRRGRIVEASLTSDPTNPLLFAEWRSLVQEKQILMDREKDLQMKAEEVRLDHRYRELDALINEKKHVLNPDDDEKAALLREMLAILDQRKALKRRLDDKNITWRRRKAVPDKLPYDSNDFRSCNPVFLNACT